MCQAEPAPRLVVAVLGLVTAACLLVLLSMLILTLWEDMAGGGAGHKRDRGARERALDTV